MRRGVGLRPPNALVLAVVQRVGYNGRAMQIVVFVHEWARLEAKLGHRIGIEAFVEDSTASRRTCYLRLEQFREAFGDELGERCTPVDLIRWPDGIPSTEALEVGSWLPVAA